MLTNQVYSVAIDGPAGSGKTTVAKALAKELNINYMDTGAMYRAIGVYLHDKGIDTQDQGAVSGALDGIRFDVDFSSGVQWVYINDIDLTNRIRFEDAGMLASVVSRYKAVREYLVKIQQDIAQNVSIVAEGRDIGTCVLPDSIVKVYLNAPLGVRSARRLNDLVRQGIDTTYSTVYAGLRVRDAQDMNRSLSRLKQAEDAILIDSEVLSVDEIVKRISDEVRRHFAFDAGM